MKSSESSGGKRISWADHPTIKRTRLTFAGCTMHTLTMTETLALAIDAMEGGRQIHHSVVNVAKIVNIQSDPLLRNDVSEADLVNIDGMGVVWGLRLLGHRIEERVAGIDLMERLIEQCAARGLKPFFLGAEPSVLEEMIKRFSAIYPRLEIAGSHHGYFTETEEVEIVGSIASSGAATLFVAMPSPRKERFLKKWRESLPVPFVMGVGGSFDVFAGKVRRAPKILQVSGLEWGYRVFQEPKRLWWRYFTTNLKFVSLMASELWRAGTARAQS